MRGSWAPRQTHSRLTSQVGTLCLSRIEDAWISLLCLRYYVWMGMPSTFQGMGGILSARE